MTRVDLLDRHEAVSLMDDPLGFEQLVTRYDDEVSRTRPDAFIFLALQHDRPGAVLIGAFAQELQRTFRLRLQQVVDPPVYFAEENLVSS